MVMQRRAWLSWGAWALGVALVVLLVRRLGTAAVLGAFTTAGPRLLWLAVAYGAATALNGLPWRLLLAPRLRPSLKTTLAGRFAASGLNALLRCSGAGEVTRLLWLPVSARPTGAAALLVDRFAFGLASVGIMGAGALAAWRLPQVPRQMGV